MKLIIGLGNPGEKYEKTRHNLGFMVVEQFLKDFEPVGQTVWVNNDKFKADTAEFSWQPKHGTAEKVIVAKPKTYMNNSGLAVSLISQSASWRISISDVWVIHDDIDLPLGAMRIRFGGASAGHHGVESVIKALNTDKFWRFRLGIGHSQRKLAARGEPRQRREVRSKKLEVKGIDDYVLGGFKGSEWGKARELIKRGAKAIEMALEEGLERAMNRFNTK